MRWQGTIEVMASQEKKGARESPRRRAPAGRRAARRTARVVAAAFVFILGNAVGAGGGAVDGEPRHRSRHRRPRRPRPGARHLHPARDLPRSPRCAQRAQVRRIGETGQYLLAELRARLFTQLQALPLSFFDKRPIGDLMSRLLSDVDTLNQLFSQGLTQLLGSILGARRHPRRHAGAQLAAGAGLLHDHPGDAGDDRRSSPRARAPPSARRARPSATVTANLQEDIVGVRQAQALNRTDVNIAKFRDRNAANRDANVAAVGITSAFSPAIDILSTLSIALVIGYGGWLVFGGRLTIGLLAAFLIYTQQFFRPVQLAASVYTLLQSALAGAERIYAILDEAPRAARRARRGRARPRRGAHHLRARLVRLRPGAPGARRRQLRRRARADGGAGGQDRRRQDDHRRPHRALLRRHRRARAARRPRPARADAGERAQAHRDGPAGAVSLLRHRSPTTSPTAGRRRAAPRSKRRRAPSTRTTSSPRCRAATRPCSARAAARSARGSGSWSPSPARCSPIRASSSSTRRRPTSTRAPKAIIQRALGTLLAGRTSVVIAHRLSTIRNADLILVIDGRPHRRARHARRADGRRRRLRRAVPAAVPRRRAERRRAAYMGGCDADAGCQTGLSPGGTLPRRGPAPIRMAPVSAALAVSTGGYTSCSGSAST